MTRKDIEKAAEEYANEACRPLWRLGSEQVCMADFIAGWDACLKYLGDIPWYKAMNEICNHITDNCSEIPNSSKKEEDNE